MRNFKGVGQSIAEMVGVARGENLCFRFQAAKGAGMNDAVAVALKRIAVGVVRLRIPAAPALADSKPKRSQHPITAAAIANAVADAVGVRLFDLPVTAERVYRGLNGER